jgi:parallel beta-helix repeat protein
MVRGIVAIALLVCFVFITPTNSWTQTPTLEGPPTAVEYKNNYNHVWPLYVPDDYPTIQAAIDAAWDGGKIIVRPGTYVENIDFLGKAIWLVSEFGPDSTVIDGSASGSVVTFQNQETSATRLEGFTIQNGDTTYGGGIDCDDASPTIAYNIITGNTATVNGSGISCTNDANPVIKWNTITGNSADTDGGGIFCYVSSPMIMNNTISANEASDDGGGIYCQNAPATIINNIISGNSAGTVEIYNSGGGICTVTAANSYTPTIINNTIHGNSAYIGGGVYAENHPPTSMTITNSIIWNNAATNGNEISDWLSTTVVSYCDVEGGYSGEGNINLDPLFVTGPTGPDSGYYLSQVAAGQDTTSPCVDAGDPLSSMIIGTTRTDEVQDSSVVDMGYHYVY